MQTLINELIPCSLNNNKYTINDCITDINSIATNVNATTEISNIRIRSIENEFIMECTNLYDQEINNLCDITNISELTLTLTDSQSNLILNSLLHKPINHLKLMECHMNDNFLYALSQLIAQNESIEKITFDKNQLMSDVNTFYCVIKAISESKNITDFVFDIIPLIQNKIILEILSETKNLQMIKININHCSDLDIFSAYITDNLRLKIIDVQKIDAEYYSSIINFDIEKNFLCALKNNTTIRSLKIHRFTFSWEYVDCIVSKLKNNQLTSLSMTFYVLYFENLVLALAENTSLNFFELFIYNSTSPICEMLQKLQYKHNLREIRLKFWFSNKPETDEFISLIKNIKSITSVKNFHDYKNDTITEIIQENNKYKSGLKTKRAYF